MIILFAAQTLKQLDKSYIITIKQANFAASYG